MNNRKTIFLIFSISIFFAIIILVWYFFLKIPGNDDSLVNPKNLPTGGEAKRGSEFIEGKQNEFEESITTTEVIPGKERRLLKVWNKPTAGLSFFDQNILINSTSSVKGSGTSTNEIIVQKRATSTRMIFADRATGYVYGYNLETKKSYQISNSTIPGIHDAYFFNNGSSVIMRYLDEDQKIATVKADIPTVLEGGTPRSLENITNLPENVLSVSVSKSQKLASYAVQNGNGSSIYKISDNKNQLLKNSPITEIDLTYGGETLYSTNKTSTYSIGYTNDVERGERVLGDKTGLITLPANNNIDYLSSMWSNTGLKLFLFSKKTGSYSVLNSKTLASKCIWGRTSTYILCGTPQNIKSPNEGLPDSWFMGLVNFTDNLYIIDNNTKVEDILFDFSSETKEEIDLIKPNLSSNDGYLGFINKNNGHLWLFNVEAAIADRQ